jgi:uncharacterized protein (DUF2384 family)
MNDKLKGYDEVEIEAISTFGNELTAKEWLNTTHQTLGKTPIEYLNAENRKDEILKILYSIKYGGVV